MAGIERMAGIEKNYKIWNPVIYLGSLFSIIRAKIEAPMGSSSWPR
jgi:hypothetical protein